jgi:hypothetical protein
MRQIIHITMGIVIDTTKIDSGSGTGISDL